MDDKSIKKAWGSRTCGILCFIGALAMIISVVGIALSFGNKAPSIDPFLITFGSGLATYALGAILWNLIEITVTSRMILRELQRKDKE